ncbi:MAG TPA: hypothetical protein VKC90_10850, partial [Chitinophagaceae bacterium]|nr:hypothetical protein [Chitinophagaceae bacterium]
MKTINKILLMMSSIFALTIMCAITVNVNAQCSSCFTAAATTDNSYGSSVSNVENTGNDINTFSGTTYKVTVWDKNNSGTYSGKLGWHVGASTGTISLGNGSTITDAHDPDVCLVQVSSTVYALTVYHSASQSMYYFQVFSWNSSAFVSSSGPTALQTTTTNFGTAINIDIDDNNVFVIVWDTPAPTVFCRTGTGITLANCPIQIKSSAKMPDIAMYWNGTNVETALITYVITSGPNGGKIEVNYQDYINQLSGCSAGSAGNPSLYTSPSPTYAFTYPRIAAANTSGF